MTIEQINELINRGGAAFGLALLIGILIFVVFRKDLEKSSKKR